MVIEVLSQKYKCGCNRGLAKFEEPDLLSKLNIIIEWDLCKFPSKIEEVDGDVEVDVLDENGNPTGEKKKEKVEKEVEDRNFLGDDPELVPGNMFLLDGQVIAVDSENTLVLVLSQTGYMSLQRVWDDLIKPEIELVYNDYPVNNVTWKCLDSFNEDYNIEARIPFKLYSQWTSHFVDGRTDLKRDQDGKLNIECVLDSDDFLFPIHLILTDHTAFVKDTEFDEEDGEEMSRAVVETLAWFVENYPRSINPLEIEKQKQESINKASQSVTLFGDEEETEDDVDQP